MLILADVKNELNITWDDDATDYKVKNIAKRAQATVSGLIGIPGHEWLDFSQTAISEPEGTEAEQLFLDCCRYMYNDAFEDFRINFAGVITSLRAFNTANAEGSAENA